MVNKEYLRVWETTKLIMKKKEEAHYIDINLLYYPYKKWNKIAAVYRPYLYSIKNTLRKDLKEKNLRTAVHGYKETLRTELSAKLERIRMMEREVRHLREKGLSSPLKDPEDFLILPE